MSFYQHSSPQNEASKLTINKIFIHEQEHIYLNDFLWPSPVDFVKKNSLAVGLGICFFFF